MTATPPPPAGEPAGSPRTALSMELVRRRLASHAFRRVDAPGNRQAATALILRDGDGGLEALLIHRAHHPNDRWSGQMALPGGHREEGDRDTRATAVRETREEVGVDLGRDAEHLGRLDELQAMARGRLMSMTVCPHVFALRRPVRTTANEEVQAILWVALDPLLRGDHDGRMAWNHGPPGTTLPCFQVGPHRIWGLTYRELCNLFEILGTPLERERTAIRYGSPRG